jgi:hypothetical protein
MDEIKVQTGLEGKENLDQASENKPISFPAPPSRSKYYGQPKNWFKGFGYMSNLSLLQEQYSQQQFHRIALNEVREALGSKCKHLIHLKDTDGKVIFRAKLLVDGNIQVFNVTAESTNPNDFVAETYKGVYDVLIKHINGNKGSKEAV